MSNFETFLSRFWADFEPIFEVESILSRFWAVFEPFLSRFWAIHHCWVKINSRVDMKLLAIYLNPEYQYTSINLNRILLQPIKVLTSMPLRIFWDIWNFSSPGYVSITKIYFGFLEPLGISPWPRHYLSKTEPSEWINHLWVMNHVFHESLGISRWADQVTLRLHKTFRMDNHVFTEKACHLDYNEPFWNCWAVWGISPWPTHVMMRATLMYNASPLLNIQNGSTMEQQR